MRSRRWRCVPPSRRPKPPKPQPALAEVGRRDSGPRMRSYRPPTGQPHRTPAIARPTQRTRDSMLLHVHVDLSAKMQNLPVPREQEGRKAKSGGQRRQISMMWSIHQSGTRSSLLRRRRRRRRQSTRCREDGCRWSRAEQYQTCSTPSDPQAGTCETSVLDTPLTSIDCVHRGDGSTDRWDDPNPLEMAYGRPCSSTRCSHSAQSGRMEDCASAAARTRRRRQADDGTDGRWAMTMQRCIIHALRSDSASSRRDGSTRTA